MSSMPLKGLRIVITRPRAQADSFAELLREEGAIPVLFPTIQLSPMPNMAALDGALSRLDSYDWIVFTSVNGVKMAFDRLAALQRQLPLAAARFAVIGPVTAAALAKHDFTAVMYPEHDYTAEGLLTALCENSRVAGKRFLLLRAEDARPTLRQGLVAAGAFVDEVSVYQTHYGQPDHGALAALRQPVDVITFTSSSTVRHFMTMLGKDAHDMAVKAVIACIGVITAQTAHELGLHVDVCARVSTIPGLIQAIKAHFYRGSTSAALFEN